MCSINGLISFKTNLKKSERDFLKQMINKSEIRGKDSFGITSFNSNQLISSNKYTTRPSNILDSSYEFDENSKVILNNNRAEPTTEYVKDKKLNDIQPMSSRYCHVVHNGTISNDKDLVEKYGLPVDTTIDSAVIPYLFDDIEANDYDSAIKVLQDELVGSYALALYNNKTKTVYLATNYKPLSIYFKDDVLYFSSFESYMYDFDYNLIFEPGKHMDVKPYTMLAIHMDSKEIKSFNLYKSRKNKSKKVVVIASSGLDSTVTASWAIEQGYDVELLHFSYNCKADAKELKHIKQISRRLGVPYNVIDLNFYKDVVGGSNLLDDSSDISKTRGGSDGAELALEWVPARNLVFMSIAAAYSEAHEIDYIILGGNLEEAGAYSDNELLFQQKFNDILPNALNLQTKVQVLTPIANMMKKDIVKLGLELGAPLDLTWSCYEDGDIHCGTCGPCFMRKMAFSMLEEKDPLKYKQ